MEDEKEEEGVEVKDGKEEEESEGVDEDDGTGWDKEATSRVEVSSVVRKEVGELLNVVGKSSEGRRLDPDARAEED